MFVSENKRHKLVVREFGKKRDLGRIQTHFELGEMRHNTLHPSLSSVRVFLNWGKWVWGALEDENGERMKRGWWV